MEENGDPAFSYEEGGNNEKDQEPVWSDEATTGDPVIWGDQITNTIKKLKSLTFFAVGSTPVPAPTASTPGTTEAEGSKQNEDKTKRKLKPQGGTKKGGGGRKGKKSGSTNNQVNVTTDAFVFLLQRGMGVTNTDQKPESETDFRWLVSFPVESLFGETGGCEGEASMGTEENVTGTEEGNSADFVAEGLGLGEVANFECVETEVCSDYNVTVKVGVENEDRRRRRNNGDKPNNTYTQIIKKALEEYPNGLTVSEIYEYISSRYSYYDPKDDRWKNSVRHNLSISPYFHKGEKAKHGAGHVWTIAEDCKDLRPSLSRRRNVPDIGVRSVEKDGVQVETEDSFQSMNVQSPIDIAVAHILGDYKRACDEVELKHSPDTFLQFHEVRAGMAQQGEGNVHEMTLPCEEIEIPLEEIQGFEGSSQLSEEHAQILSFHPDENICLVEKGSEVVDLHVEPGMIINLESYFQQEDIQLFMEEEISSASQ